MDAQRRTVLVLVTQGVGYASCMCDWDISYVFSSQLLYSSLEKLVGLSVCILRGSTHYCAIAPRE